MPDTNKNAVVAGYACSMCGRRGHNSRGCVNRGTRIDRVGVEVEGYWNDLFATKRLADSLGLLRGCRDGSLGAYDGAWEFQTTPGTVAHAQEIVAKIYPDKYASDAGMHVHVSFKDGPCTVGMFANEAFFSYWDTQWEEWARVGGVRSTEFFARLRGENSYCRKPTMRMFYDQANIVDMDRYNQLNFGAWNEHRTIESRLLPLFRDSAVAIAAIAKTAEIFDSWAQTRGPEMLTAAPVVATFSPAAIRRIVGEGEIEFPSFEVAETIHELDLYDGEATPGMTRVPVASVARVLGGR